MYGIMGRTKRRRGHFCWVCGCVRSNESFSGRGHRRHVCRDCKRLVPARLEALQTIRNMERELRGKWRRNQRVRGRLEALVMHPTLEVRAFAVDGLHGPHLYLDADGSLEFAWLEFADELDWDDEYEWEYDDDSHAELADGG